MIISHKHKFIFIKTNKTAGTSIEIGLSKFCGPDDILTPQDPVDEATRTELGYTGPQNNPPKIHIRNVEKILRGRPVSRRFYDHIGASEICKHIAPDLWNSYYKICFERNPWDRVISAYYWQNKNTDARPAMDAYLDSVGITKLKKSGIGLYTIDGKVVVDKICRFEDMAGELEAFRQHVGLPEPVELPRAKSGFRKDKRHYRDILTPAQRDKIAALFADEIALMGYEY